jgi:hypothetical protein
LTVRMACRRFTRLTNAFSKKLENLKAALALHFAWYNLVRIHRTLRVTSAMAAGRGDGADAGIERVDRLRLGQMGMVLAVLLEVVSDLLFLARPNTRLMAFTVGAIWTIVLAAVAWGLWRLMSP